MNWGWKLFFVYSGFVVLIMTLVIKSGREKIELVRTDYYEAEIAHQSQLNAMNNTKHLSAPVRIAELANFVELTFPSECNGIHLPGEVYAYRPSDSNLDRTFPIVLNEQNAMRIPASEFQRGLYVMKVNWTMLDKTYYFEESILVQQ